jgi:hypothetical protein
MCAIGWVLWSLGPTLPELRSAATDPQAFVDRSGADALVLVAVPVLAWLCWGWGALGLVLTAASTVPGASGRLAGVLVTGLLPAGARRAAAVALGLTLGTAPALALLPAATAPAGVTAVATAAAAEDLGSAPGGVASVDWPGAQGDVVPDWPGAPDPPGAAADAHVVLRGDCLWEIASGRLQRDRPGTPATDAEVAQAVQAWWQANAEVIGPDPDLLLPGQVLRPPG